MDTVGLEAGRADFADVEQLLEEFHRRAWTDGLPIVPPTPEAVMRHVEASGLPPLSIVGRIPPKWGEATVQKIAVNSVMAGCLPGYMPLLVTAVQAMLVEQFNLYGVQATTHPCAIALLINGPIATTLGIHAGTGAFGPGWRPNASIGRAIRLILLNLGGAQPGILDHATQGTPAKFSYCFAENEEASPWPPLSAARGFAKDVSVVTVAAIEGPHNINDHGSSSGEQVLQTIAGAMSGAGSNCLYLSVADSFLFLGPEHAAQIARAGYSRQDIQDYLFHHARTPTAWIGSGHLQYLRRRHRDNPRYHELGLDADSMDSIPILSKPDDIQVAVVGGHGRHSAWAPGTGPVSRSVSAQVGR